MDSALYNKEAKLFNLTLLRSKPIELKSNGQETLYLIIHSSLSLLPSSQLKAQFNQQYFFIIEILLYKGCKNKKI